MKKFQASEETFVFTFALAWCEWALRHVRGTNEKKQKHHFARIGCGLFIVIAQNININNVNFSWFRGY